MQVTADGNTGIQATSAVVTSPLPFIQRRLTLTEVCYVNTSHAVQRRIDFRLLLQYVPSILCSSCLKPDKTKYYFFSFQHITLEFFVI